MGVVGSLSIHLLLLPQQKRCLPLGPNLGQADRVVPTTDEETVIVGTIPPVTTRDEWARGSITKGAKSSSSMSNKASISPRLGLMDIEKGIIGDCDRRGYPLEIDSLKGFPIIGSKLYHMVDPHIE